MAHMADPHLARVFEPAFVNVCGTVIPGDDLRKLRWLEREVRETLERVLERPCATALERLDDTLDAIDPDDPPFIVRLRSPGGTFQVWLDGAVARGLAEAVGRNHGGFARPGALTDAERGMLQYAVLRVLEGLATNHDVHVAVEAFLEPKAAKSELEGSPSCTVFRAWIHGRTGCALVAPAPDLGRLPALPATNTLEPDPALTADVRLALPPLVLTNEEVHELSAGDVVLLGASSWDHWGSALHLVSTTGWQLGRVVIEEDGPRAIRVRCTSFEPRAEDLHHADDDTCVLRAYVGTACMTLERLQTWRTGAVLELVKPTDTPVLIAVNELRFDAELVRASGELALRVIRRREEIA